MAETQLPNFKQANTFGILQENIIIKKFNGLDPDGKNILVDIERKKNDVIYYYNPSIDNPQYSNLDELKKKYFLEINIDGFKYFRIGNIDNISYIYMKFNDFTTNNIIADKIDNLTKGYVTRLSNSNGEKCVYEDYKFSGDNPDPIQDITVDKGQLIFKTNYTKQKAFTDGNPRIDQYGSMVFIIPIDLSTGYRMEKGGWMFLKQTGDNPPYTVHQSTPAPVSNNQGFKASFNKPLYIIKTTDKIKALPKNDAIEIGPDLILNKTVEYKDKITTDGGKYFIKIKYDSVTGYMYLANVNEDKSAITLNSVLDSDKYSYDLVSKGGINKQIENTNKVGLTTFDSADITQENFHSKYVYFYEKCCSFYEFTNFYDCTFNWGKLPDDPTIDVSWTNSEVAFQAAKFLYAGEPNKVYDNKRHFKNMIGKKAYQAFKYARKKADYWDSSKWAKIKDAIMTKIVYCKFKCNKLLFELLDATGDRILVENAGTNDCYWGNGGTIVGKTYDDSGAVPITKKMKDTGAGTPKTVNYAERLKVVIANKVTLPLNVLEECGEFFSGSNDKTSKLKYYNHILLWTWEFPHCNKLGQILMWVRAALTGKQDYSYAGAKGLSLEQDGLKKCTVEEFYASAKQVKASMDLAAASDTNPGDKDIYETIVDRILEHPDLPFISKPELDKIVSSTEGVFAQSKSDQKPANADVDNFERTEGSLYILKHTQINGNAEEEIEEEGIAGQAKGGVLLRNKTGELKNIYISPRIVKCTEENVTNDGDWSMCKILVKINNGHLIEGYTYKKNLVGESNINTTDITELKTVVPIPDYYTKGNIPLIKDTLDDINFIPSDESNYLVTYRVDSYPTLSTKKHIEAEQPTIGDIDGTDQSTMEKLKPNIEPLQGDQSVSKSEERRMWVKRDGDTWTEVEGSSDLVELYEKFETSDDGHTYKNINDDDSKCDIDNYIHISGIGKKDGKDIRLTKEFKFTNTGELQKYLVYHKSFDKEGKLPEGGPFYIDDFTPTYGTDDDTGSPSGPPAADPAPAPDDGSDGPPSPPNKLNVYVFDDDTVNLNTVEGEPFDLNLPEGITEGSVIKQLKKKINIQDENEYNIMYVDDDFDDWFALVPFDITKIKDGSKLTLTKK
jgi:ribA/ribD-fused uncharacterized protein